MALVGAGEKAAGRVQENRIDSKRELGFHSKIHGFAVRFRMPPHRFMAGKGMSRTVKPFDGTETNQRRARTAAVALLIAVSAAGVGHIAGQQNKSASPGNWPSAWTVSFSPLVCSPEPCIFMGCGLQPDGRYFATAGADTAAGLWPVAA